MRKLAEADGRCALRDAGSGWLSLVCWGAFGLLLACALLGPHVLVCYFLPVLAGFGNWGVGYRTIVLFCNGCSDVRQAVRWAVVSPLAAELFLAPCWMRGVLGLLRIK